MGATFPIAVAWLVRTTERANATSESTPAATAGVLYAANTAGAAIGAIGAGFWLIPAIGLRATTWMGIALNTAAAIGALWLARAIRRLTRRASRKSRRTARHEPPQPPFRVHALACAAAALSGFLSLVYEVTWTRLLALVLGPTTYAFATMAASFITGIAFGSFIGTRLARRVSDPALWLGGMLVVTAVSAPAAAWFAASRVPMFVASHVNAGAAFESILLQQALAVAFFFFRPASLSAPALFSQSPRRRLQPPRSDGTRRACTWRTPSARSRARCLPGFVLIPHLGLQSSFVEISRVGAIGGIAVAALALLQRTRRRALIGTLALAAAVAAVFGTLPDWDRQLLASGAYKYSRNLDSRGARRDPPGGKARVLQRGRGRNRQRAPNGRVARAGDRRQSRRVERRRYADAAPAWPAARVAHTTARVDALVIGLGSGVTADAVLASGEVQRIDVVEISPEVVEASAYFEHENRES